MCFNIVILDFNVNLKPKVMKNIDQKNLRELEIQRGKEIKVRVKAGFSEEDMAKLYSESSRILDVDLKTLTALEELDIFTLGDFGSWSIDDFMRVRSITYTSFKRLEEELASLGIELMGNHRYKEDRKKRQGLESSIFTVHNSNLLAPIRYERKRYMEREDYAEVWKLNIVRGIEIQRLINEGPIEMDTAFILDESVTILDLSTRARNCLLYSDILTIGELLATSIYELSKLRNVGKLSIEEIDNELVKFKFGLQKYPFRKQKVSSKAPESKMPGLLNESVYTLKLSPWTSDFLSRKDIFTIGELIATPVDKLKGMVGLTSPMLKDIELKLAKKGLELSTKVK